MSEWYYATGGQQHGPVPLDKLQAMIRTGQVDPFRDLVWAPHMKDWKPASQVPELGQYQASSSLPGLIQASQGPRPGAAGFSAAPMKADIEGGSDPIGVIECIQRGFDLTKVHFVNILLVMLILFGVQMVFGIVIQLVSTLVLATAGIATGAASPQGSGPASENIALVIMAVLGVLVMYLVMQAIGIYLQLGMIRFGLNLVDGAPAEVSQIFAEGGKLPRAFGATLLYAFAVLAGFLFFIVPGIYIALRYGQFLTAIVDRNLGIMEAFRHSATLTQNNLWRLLGLGILSGLVATSGILLCGVGMIFTAPIAWLSLMVAYRWMQTGRTAAGSRT